MDEPGKTFGFITEFQNCPVNNGFLPFTTVSDVRLHIKTQLAFLFGDLLRSRFDPVKSDVKDVLAEVKALRNELQRQTSTERSDRQAFLRAIRFLLDDSNRSFAGIVEQISGSLEDAVETLLRSTSFEDFVKKAGKTMYAFSDSHIIEQLNDGECCHQWDINPVELSLEPLEGSHGIITWGGGALRMMGTGLPEWLEGEFVRLRRACKSAA